MLLLVEQDLENPVVGVGEIDQAIELHSKMILCLREQRRSLSQSWSQPMTKLSVFSVTVHIDAVVRSFRSSELGAAAKAHSRHLPFRPSAIPTEPLASVRTRLP